VKQKEWSGVQKRKGATRGRQGQAKLCVAAQHRKEREKEKRAAKVAQKMGEAALPHHGQHLVLPTNLENEDEQHTGRREE